MKADILRPLTRTLGVGVLSTGMLSTVVANQPAAGQSYPQPTPASAPATSGPFSMFGPAAAATVLPPTGSVASPSGPTMYPPAAPQGGTSPQAKPTGVAAQTVGYPGGQPSPHAMMPGQMPPAGQTATPSGPSQWNNFNPQAFQPTAQPQPPQTYQGHSGYPAPQYAAQPTTAQPAGSKTGGFMSLFKAASDNGNADAKPEPIPTPTPEPQASNGHAQGYSHAGVPQSYVPMGAYENGMSHQGVVMGSPNGGPMIDAPVMQAPIMQAPVQGSDCQTCNTGSGNAYTDAAAAPWSAAGMPMSGMPMAAGACGTDTCGPMGVAARPTLFPWFGGFNLLFLSFEDNTRKVYGIDNGYPAVWSDIVDPDSSVGFEAYGGRYVGCGRWGIGVGVFHLDPDQETYIYTHPGAITATNFIRPAMQSYHDYHMDFGSGQEQVYNHITGTSGGSSGAANVRAQRDVQFDGVEVNLYCFGLMGAQRAAPMCGDGIASAHWYRKFLGLGAGGYGGRFGYGGAAGPLVRPCNGRLQIVSSHGFRWFQFDDKTQLAYNINGTAGYQFDDIYDTSCVENDLFGYQAGGRLVFCLTNRLNLNCSGKFGLYGNHAQAYRRVGTENVTAYRFGDPMDLAETNIEDTVLATLGELDLGLGYRLSNAWTVRGGYRVMGLSGVATSTSQIAQDYGTSRHPDTIHATDSVFLHGAYVGADFNF
ncbi:BBP7 family outer membrane beta-barrel protein [Crateriforma conspicua]|uniref:BBP7 family outer membrane beta-barrel protein n=1 Tax=Crateriforma conspicua TaxID=2527996 RepID=UPI00118BA1D6|nr:BBP7 family outer membrane beta-barrel protein [Crateriforma conspicua]QDV63736.1 hypothetical protein Mal65_28820 [Crateriforma conspicua]